MEKWMVRNVRFDTDKFAQAMGISNDGLEREMTVLLPLATGIRMRKS